MPLTFSIQSQIAFKNLLGKSQTDSSKGIVNEFYGINFDISSNNLWLDNISSDSSVAVLQGTTVEVVADLGTVSGSNEHAYFTYWPSLPPSGYDIKTGNIFSYGLGSLSNISAGDRMTGLIPDAYGVSYSAIPYVSYPSNEIPPLDSREWFYQYNSGIFYQDFTTSPQPSKIKVFPYLGSKLSTTNTQENIRVTAFGTNSYFATFSTPTIATYSNNYLFLIDFVNSNTSGTVSLNINGIGTQSVKQNGTTGLIDLTVGDIVGATGSTAGPIYYLIYNNNTFQFFRNSPIQLPSSYTKLNSTKLNSVGTIEKGTSFDGVLIQDMFTDLLYGDELGNISSVSIIDNSGNYVPQSIEVGNTFSAGTYTFSVSFINSGLFASNSTRIVREGFGDIVSATNNNGLYTWNLTSGINNSGTTSEIFSIYIKRTNNTIISKPTTIDWMYPIYYGSDVNTSVTAPTIVTFTKFLATQSIFAANISGSGYKYIATPEAFQPFYRITSGGLPVAMAATQNGYNFFENRSTSYGTISSIYHQKIYVTNSYGIGATYNVFRTLNFLKTDLFINTSDGETRIESGPSVISGKDGMQGPVGPVGSVGATGSQGPTGPSGGPVGPTGPQGTTGPAGNVTDIDISYKIVASGYALTTTDVNKVVFMSHSNVGTVSVPTFTYSIATGSQIMLVNWSGLTLSVTNSSPVIVNSADNAKRIRTRYSAATLVYLGSDRWLLSGDITI